MKRVAWAALLLVLAAMSATALDTALVPSDSDDLLSVIALPLAVAAVADVAGVPLDELSNLVGVLNDGAVPARQMIETIRYAPVALVVHTEQPAFVPFVREQVSSGVTGPKLVTVIDQRLRTLDVTPQFASSQVTVVDKDFVPPVVITRVEKERRHPHGGPPGQLKKIEGVQTGAEIVHRERHGHDHDRGHGGNHGHGHGGGHGKGKH